ncbi:MAG: NAD(P)H-binding protein [Anaerolineaceae bacterium]|nr:NAD(P)H-binding protein [Anaerolineaceae bacterium]
MNVFIVGGTGFLGYYTTLELLKQGHNVSTVSLPPVPAKNLLPEEVKIELADINKMSDEAVVGLLNGSDAVIYAAGVDDRTVPRRPAYPYFYQGNVASTERLIRLAKQAGVKRAVIYSSYFLYFDRIWPEMQLAQKHVYIRSRKEQAEAAIKAGEDTLDVMILELPYIFGKMPGRQPLWQPLLKYIRSKLPFVFYVAGGTTMISVLDVAEAAVGALKHGKHGEHYPLGGENLTWNEFITRLLTLMGKTKKVITLPTWMVKIGASFVKLSHIMKGKESGLDMIPFIDLQTRNTFIDSESSQNALGYAASSLDNAFRDTIEASKKGEDRSLGETG